MSTITVELPDDLRASLTAVSAAQRCSVNEFVVESVRRRVAVAKFHALRDRIVPQAAERGFLTDEDVFKAVS